MPSLLFVTACFWAEPEIIEQQHDIDIERIWTNLQPNATLELPEQLHSVLDPCLSSVEQNLLWEGFCSYDNIYLEGQLELTNEWLLAEHFTLYIDDEIHLYLDGSIKWIEYDDLLRIESAIYMCTSSVQCQAQPILHTLTSNVYPFSSYPNNYEVNVSGLLVLNDAYRIDAIWEYRHDLCSKEPILGFLGIGEYELHLNGTLDCDGCGTLNIQGFPFRDTCHLSQ